MNTMRIKIYILLCCVFCAIATASAQSDDFTTWTLFKVNYKVDPRFSILSNIEFRTKDDVSRTDRWGFALGGEYRANSFLKFDAGYEIHQRNLGDSEWKPRHRYNLGATASFRYQWLKVSLRERFQQTFDRGDSETRLRSRLKLAYAPKKGIVSPYFSVEIYQSLDDASFWRADRMRYRPGVEVDLAEHWSLDAFYCYQHEDLKSKHIVGVEVGFSF